MTTELGIKIDVDTDRGTRIGVPNLLRMFEEMGIKSFLTRAFQFIYRAQLTDELVEHEVDHVFAGEFEGDPAPDETEVMEWRWMNVQQLRTDLTKRPHLYTKWLGLALEKFA